MIASKPGSLIAFRSDRLGARLISILNTQRIAKDYSLDYKIFWLEKWELTEPRDIFDQVFIEERFISKPELVRKRDNGLPLGSVAGATTPNVLIDLIQSGKNVLVDTHMGVFHFPFEDPTAVKLSFLECIDQLPFSQKLQASIDKIRAKFDNFETQTVAYHIRRGDLTGDVKAMNRSWPNKFVPDEIFESHIKANIVSNTQTVLFSDNQEVLDLYTKKFPELLTFKDLVDAEEVNQSQLDFLELYTMSLCQSIVAPAESAFSSAAATIGNAKKLDVGKELSPEASEEALEKLFLRLKNHPESFSNKGEIGQYLIYADEHLIKTGRRSESASLLFAHVEDGLVISFVFGMLARRLFELGEYKKLLRLRELVDQSYVVSTRSYAQVLLYHGCALMMLGRQDDANAQFSNMYWHEPVEGEINALTGQLYSQEVLHKKNFFFADSKLMPYFSNPTATVHLQNFFSPMIEAGVLSLPSRRLPAMRLTIWEWDAFVRLHINRHFRYRGHFKEMLKIFGHRRWHSHEQASADSMKALVLIREGLVDDAKGPVFSAVEAEPENALFRKRVSEYYLFKEDFNSAIKSIEETVQMEPDVPLYNAQHAYICALAGRYDEAESAYKRATNGSVVSPLVYFQYFNVLMSLGMRGKALGALKKGVSLHPQEWRMSLKLAKLLHQTGKSDDAKKLLEKMQEWCGYKPQVPITLSKILDETGFRDDAISILKEAAGKFPEKKNISNALAALHKP